MEIGGHIMQLMGRNSMPWEPPLDTRIPLQTNSYDCGVFVCLYAAFIDIQHPLSFSQRDIDNVCVWMAHEMIEEGKS
jgi:Ulp1 family protease